MQTKIVGDNKIAIDKAGERPCQRLLRRMPGLVRRPVVREEGVRAASRRA
jgi:hypothetical protein